jgi:hypothetical protein
MDANQKGVKNLGSVDIPASHLIDANVPWFKVWPNAAKPEAMQKRIMEIAFTREVNDDDISTGLVKGIMDEEVGPLLVLQVRAYQAVLQAASDKTFDALKIDYFNRIRLQADPLVAFIQACGDYEDGGVTTVRDLRELYNGELTVSWDASSIKKALDKINATLEGGQAYEYEEETRSHRFECKHCHQDVGAGNGNEHYTGESFALDIPVVCQAYIDDTRPKTANINRQTGVRADTKATKIKLNKKLDFKIKNLVLNDAT